MKERVSVDDLANDLTRRQESLRADRNIHTISLKGLDAREMIIYSFGHIVKGLERKASLVDLAVTLGRRVKLKYKLKRDSIGACHVGWFILVSFIELGLVEYELKSKKTKRGRNSKYKTYGVKVRDKTSLFALWDDILEDEEIDMFPAEEPAPDWSNGYNEMGYTIVKKASGEINGLFKAETHQYLFDVLNKLNRTPWIINTRVLDTFKWYMDNEQQQSPFKHHTERDPGRRESHAIEANAIRRLAEKNRDNLFYHLYNCDFRGRIYTNTAFLHDQGSDSAKGLLLLANAKPMNGTAMFYLMLHAANNWGYDKAPLADRVEYVQEHYDEFLSYGEDPIANRGWLAADKPWCFLAACNELFLIQSWIDAGKPLEEFISGLPIHIDGSLNGLQHLTAISRDEEMAPHVNLAATSTMGDMYSFVAEKVWKRLEIAEEKLSDELIAKFESVLATAARLQEVYDRAPVNSEAKALAFKEVQLWRNNNRELREKMFPVYWNRITDVKTRRKIVKRGCMVVPSQPSWGL